MSMYTPEHIETSYFENDYEDPYYEERESTVVDTTSVYVD